MLSQIDIDGFRPSVVSVAYAEEKSPFDTSQMSKRSDHFASTMQELPIYSKTIEKDNDSDFGLFNIGTAVNYEAPVKPRDENLY